MAIDTEERVDSPKAAAAPGVPVTPGAKAPVSNKKVITIVLIVVGALVVLGIVGSILSTFMLKKGAETLLGAATGGTVKIDTKGDDAEISIKTKDGEIKSGSSQKLPKDFPESVPLYNGKATLEGVSSMKVADQGASYTLTYNVSDKPEAVRAFYEKELAQNGWTTTLAMSQGSDSYSFVGKNESALQGVTISIIEGSDGVVTKLSILANPITESKDR